MKKKAKRIAEIMRNDSVDVVAQMIVDDFLFDSYEIYTDGACKNGVGGCAWLILHKGAILKSGHTCFLSINNDSVEAELRAVILALGDCPSSCVIDVYIDCQVVIGKIEDRKLGKLLRLYNNVSNDKVIRFHWIKAHHGNIYNEMVDSLAYSAIEC